MELFKMENIDFAIEASSQEEVLQHFAEMAEKLGYVDDASLCYQSLLKREAESTTGFGNGVAIPHARYEAVKHASILFGRLNHSVEWQAMDGAPVEICLCILAPENQGNLHLTMLSKLTRKLIYDDFIQMLKDSNDAVSLTEAIQSALQ